MKWFKVIKDKLVTIFYLIAVIFVLSLLVIYEGFAWIVKKITRKDISIKWYNDSDIEDYY